MKILTVVHFASLFGILLYGVHRLWLVSYWYKKHRRSIFRNTPLKFLPQITVQLPIFNERFVAARLIESAVKLDWPVRKLEIQVLDDSTDDTTKIVDEKVAEFLDRGIDIKIIRRNDRDGYKAGALKNGTAQAKGEFIAIFDADFMPNPDFLIKTIPLFSDPKVGMVQARWTFLNSEFSWLTGIQALLLNPHFTIEHWVRFKRRLFFNFNGTAGIWRRVAIESAGGWQSDTVTEDLDLSYRAQLNGWKFAYLNNTCVPSELPITLAAFRSQQQRWAKGSIQTAKKILPRLLSSQLPLKIKVEATAHLLANTCWLFGSVATLTLYAAITWRTGIGPYQLMTFDVPLFAGTSCAILLYFLVYLLASRQLSSLRWLILLPVFSIGMSPSISLSVVRGVFTNGGYFERTPKYGLHGHQKPPILAFLYRQRAFPYIVLNAVLLCYSILPILYAWERNTWLAIPLLMLFPCGFLLVLIKDLADIYTIRRWDSVCNP